MATNKVFLEIGINGKEIQMAMPSTDFIRLKDAINSNTPAVGEYAVHEYDGVHEADKTIIIRHASVAYLSFRP